jgi:pantoate--beta-alanine ligase
MHIIESIHDMQAAAMRLRTDGKLIGLVSTSGLLHAGHLSLIDKAREQADTVVVSSFVNPREFGPNEDFKRYPRDREHDIRTAREAGVDILFLPREDEFYGERMGIAVLEEGISQTMCGVSRPHYFRGVCTYHTKLFNLVRPDFVAMGLRDAQKCAVIRRLVQDLNFPIEILLADTVREADGLAVNTRNRYLNDFQRRDAVGIHRALLEGKRLVDNGISNIDRVLAEVTHHISQARRLRVIYVAAVDFESMEPMREVVRGRTLVTTAVWCDEVRLLDNILL